MGKFRKGKILVIAILMIFVSFFAFTGKASAVWTTCNTEGAPIVHLFIDGEEVNEKDPGTQVFIRRSSSSTSQKCYLMEINQGYRDYDIGWRDNEKQWIWSDASGQRGLIYWYDNPEFEGEPITHFRLPRDKGKTFNLYGKMGKIITIYINGHKKYVVAGREYTPYTLDPDYTVQAGYTDEYSNDREFTGDFNYFNVMDPEFYEDSYKDKNVEYYRDATKRNPDGNSRSTIIPEKGTVVNANYPDLLPFIDPNTCNEVTAKSGSFVNCTIVDPKTGVGITDEAAARYYGVNTHYRYQAVQETYKLPKYYKYVGFIDQNGNFYDPVFEMKEEYAGYNFTPIVESQMSCSTVYIARSVMGVDKPYGLKVMEQGARLDEDFNSDYYTHVSRVWYTYSYSADIDGYVPGIRREYFTDGRISPAISTCTPNETNMTILYSGLKNPDTEYAVVLEGTDGIKVKKGSQYTLPTEGKPKAAEVKTVTLKYQDGTTPNDVYSYTKTYTPIGFKIDGVHYDFGQTIVINKDTYIYYDYEGNVEGPDLPTPTREHYNFKGWFDASMGGHAITDPRTLIASVYYAQWTDKDKVTVIRTDNISIELDKGSQYTIEEIPYKPEDIIARVAFNYNDSQGTKKVSQVTKYYDKNGATIEGTDEHYNSGDTIVVNQDIRLIANYTERITPATFPINPERENYEFLGWFDQVEGGQEYTEYSGNQDLTLFAHWQGGIEYAYITYPNGYCYYDKNNTRQCTDEEQVDRVAIGSQYTLKEVNTKEYSSFVDFYWGEEEYWSIIPETSPYIYTSDVSEEEVANGWFIDGNHYDEKQTITVDGDINVIKDVVMVKHPAVFPEDPVREGYRFNGWIDRDYHMSYTYFDDAWGLVNDKYNQRYFILIADWEEDSDLVTVTTPYEKVSIPRGSEYVLPEYVQKDDEIAATVTLKYNDGLTKDKEKYVYRKFIPLNWLINDAHTYNGKVYYAGDTIVVNEDIVVTQYYLNEITDAELLPATREGYNFLGWFANNDRFYSWGSKNVYYVDGIPHVADIIFHAKWQAKGEEDILCKRATTLHTETCTSTGLCSAESWGAKYSPGETITYGQLGKSGKLVPGDAYTCDVNGDGVFDEETERFYYVSDYYVTDVDEFDNTYATLVYYKNVFYGDNPFVWRPGTEYYYVSAYSCGANWEVGTKCSGYGDLIGPKVAMQYLPSTEDWPNTSLYFATREYDVGSGRKIDYSGKAARLLTAQEASNKSEANHKYFGEYLFENTIFDKLTNYSEPENTNYDYWLESSYKNTSTPRAWTLTSGNFVDWVNGIRPAIDVPKYRMEIGEVATNTITYPDGKIDVVARGETYKFDNNTSTKENENSTQVTFNLMNEEDEIVKYATRSFIASGWIATDDTHYNDGEEITITKDIVLQYDYVATDIPVEFPEDPTRSGYIFKGWYDAVAGGNKYTSYSDDEDITLYARWENEDTSLTHTITYPNGDTEIVEHGAEWVFPINDAEAIDPEFGSWVEFYPQNGKVLEPGVVQRGAIPAGWKIGDDHYNDGETIIVNSDITLEYDYVETIIPAAFPEDPEKIEYEFIGWFSEPVGGKQYTNYSDPENDISLYAHYIRITTPDDRLYDLGVNDTQKANEHISTVTFKYHDGVTADTTSEVYRQFKPNGWYVDGQQYINNSVIIKEDDTVITPRYTETVKNAEFPSNPTKDGYEFIGWFTEEEGGEQVTVYNGTEDIVLHAHYSDSYAYLITGPTFDTKYYTYGNNAAEYINRRIEFRKATVEEYNEVAADLTSDNIVSTSDSPNVVYMWYIVGRRYNGQDILGEILYYSEADIIFANPDSSQMFRQPPGSTNFKMQTLDVSGINTSKVTNMNQMFNNTTALQINLGSFNTSNVTNMGGMFADAKLLTSLDVTGFDTSNVTNMLGMFSNCQELTELDVSNFDTHLVDSFNSMFKQMKKITYLDLSNFDSSNVRGMTYMFEGDTALVSVDLSSFNTSKVFQMQYMFSYCESLEELDLSNFDTSNNSHFGAMFQNCRSLRSVNVSSFDMDNNAHLYSMFQNCESLTELDLSSFSVHSWEDIEQMFAGASNLETIYVSDLWDTNGDFNEYRHDSLFRGDTKLVGQEGTTYDADIYNTDDQRVIDAVYAHIDEGPSNPGYFTYKPRNVITHTITYPDGSKQTVVHGDELILDVLPSDEVEVGTVTFVYNNGDDNTTSAVTKETTYNSWLVNDEPQEVGYYMTVLEDIVLTYDKTETFTPAEFPEDPTRDEYEFVGWYDAVAGGNGYTSYDKLEDITLYAKWRPLNTDGDVLCKKYPNWNETSHSEDEIRTGDAFVCDVNGNGIYNEDDEMFYYVSDYYDTKNKEFDESYSVLIRNYNMDGNYTETSIEGALDTCYSGDAYWTNESCNDVYNGPDNAILYLPTTSDWSNVSLYHTERDILTVNGENTYNGHTLPEDFSYDGYAARFLTSQEIARGCNVNITSSNYNRVYLYDIGCGFLTDHLEDAIGEGYTVYRNYYLENPIDGSSKTYLPLMIDSGALTNSIMDNGGVGVRPAIDVPKERIEGFAEKYYTVTYPSGDKEYVKAGETFTFPYSADGVTREVATVTFKPMNGEDDIIRKVIYQDMYGWKIGDDHYNDGDTIVVNDDIYLEYDYISTTIPVEFPEDIVNDTFTFVGWFDEIENGTQYTEYSEYSDITLYAHWSLEPDENDTLILPINNIAKDDDTFIVTFVYNNGQPNTKSTITASYTPDGWLVNGVLRQAGYVVEHASEATIEPNYSIAVTDAVFPSDPTKARATFTGWYNAEGGGERFTSYNEAADITLYAHWNYEVCENPTSYTLGTNDTEKDDVIIGTVTFKYHNGAEDTTANVVKYYQANGWLVDGVRYPDGTAITKCDNSVIEPYYSEFIGNAMFPSNPTKEDYEFVGWFTEEEGGEQVTLLRDSGNITLHAQYTSNYAYLINGSAFRNRLYSMIEPLPYENGYVFRKATKAEYNSVASSLDSSNIISTQDSPNEVYLWVDNKKALYYSDADVIYLNSDCSHMFHYEYGYTQLGRFGSLDFSKLNSSKVTSMYYMFYSYRGTTLNLGNFDTSKVTNMQSTFSGAYNLTSLDVSGFDTSSVVNFNSTFLGLTVESLDTSNFNTHNATTLQNMFYRLGTMKELDLSNFDTSNATNISGLFGHSTKLEHVDVSSFDTSKVTTIREMFTQCESLEEVDLSSFDTSKVTDAYAMFEEATNLKTIYVSEKWDVSKATSHNSMFTDAVSIVGQKGTTYNSGYTNKIYAIVDDAPDHPGYLTLKGYITPTYTITYPDGMIEVVPAGSEFIFPSSVPAKDADNFAKVTFKPENGEEDIIRYVTKTYTNPGWMIDETHYDIGDTYIVDRNITLAYDYIETINGVRFPEDPTLEGDTFLGWYDAKVDGEEYIHYAGTEDLTLYAHWTNGGIPSTDILCRRAKYLHTDICEWDSSAGSYSNRLGCVHSGQPYKSGDTIYYGYLGENGVLTKYDAFTCDVNGDEIFDEETERFYYISDYYNTRTDSFEDDTAVLLYYTNREDGVDYQHNVLYDNEYGWNGPIGLLPYLPTTEEWPNVSLKESVRQLTTNTGQRAGYYYNGNTQVDYELGEIDYGNSAARIPTAKEMGNYEDWEATIVENTWYNKRLGNHYSYATESIYPTGENNYSYDIVASNQMMWQSSTKGSTSNSWGIRPVIDVPKDRMDLSMPTKYDIYIDDTKVADVYKGEEYIVPENTTVKAGETLSTVTFKDDDDDTISTSDVTTSYVPNGYKLGNRHYNTDDSIVVNEDIYLTSDYIETVTGATFPSDPFKDHYNFIGWYDGVDSGNLYSAYDGDKDLTLYPLFELDSSYCYVTYDNGDIETYLCGSNIEVPTYKAFTDAWLDFDYNKGIEYVQHVEFYKIKQIDYYDLYGTHYVPGDQITVDRNMTITRVFGETTFEGEFPPNDDDNFIGWFTDRTDGRMYRNYPDYKANNATETTLYAHYETDNLYSVFIDGELYGRYAMGSTFSFPDGESVDKDIATVTFVNGENTTTAKVHATKSFDHYSLNGTDYNVGDTETVNGTMYIYSVYSNENITPVTITELEDTEYSDFGGWWDEPHGVGTRYFNSYSGEVDLTLYADFKGKSAFEYYYDSKDGYSINGKAGYYGDEIDTSDVTIEETGYGNNLIHLVLQNPAKTEYDINIEVKQKIDHWVDDDDKVYGIVHTIDFVGYKSLYAVLGDDYVVDTWLADPDSQSNIGYDFIGWYTKPIGGEKVAHITEDKPITLYAHWVPNDDPVCRYSTGEAEYCYPGDTLTVPKERYENLATVYEIVNTPNHENEIYDTYYVSRIIFVDYYEIDGVKYYPGDEYTIEENPYIEVKYTSSTIEPAMLYPMDENDVGEYFDGDTSYHFTGWFTDRTGGAMITSYAGEENIKVYAQYYDDNKTTYNVTFERLNGNTDSYDVPTGTKILLSDDIYVDMADFTLNIDDGENTDEIAETAYATIADKNYSVNGMIYDKGSEIVVNQNLYIRTLGDEPEIVYVPEIITPTKEGYVFSGWFDDNHAPFDFDNITVDEFYNLYGRTFYGVLQPKGADDVTVDFDGIIMVIPRGTTEALPDDGSKSDTFYIELDTLRDSIQDLTIARNYELDYYLVNGQTVEPGADYTFNEDTVIRSQYNITYDYDDDYGFDYPELPDLSSMYSDFLGWYDSAVGGNEVEDASGITEFTTLYARYPAQYKLTVDGETTYVPEGYVYTVPSNGSVLSEYITINLNYNYDDIITPVKIGYGKSIAYQNINGTRYEPSDIYIVNQDTVVESVTTGDGRTIMVPEVQTPTREGYLFVGWLTEPAWKGTLYQSDIIDIYELTPEDKTFDGKMLYAQWRPNESIDDDEVKVTFIDKYRKLNFTNTMYNGTTIDSLDYIYNLDTNTIENNDIYNQASLLVIDNMENESDNLDIHTEALIQYYLVNGVRYEKGSSYTINGDTTIEVVRNVTTWRDISGRWKDVIYQDVNTLFEDYRYLGTYNNPEYEGEPINVSEITIPGDYYSRVEINNPPLGYDTLYIKFVSSDDYIILTVDGEVSLIPKGMGTIPEAKTKESDKYMVRYDYNDGTNKVVTDYINVNYTFDHYVVEGKGNYEAGEAYNYLEDTTMNSSYTRDIVYPRIRTIKTENFEGWFTEPHGGERITTLEGITSDITLYARYNNEHVNIYIDNVANPVLYGEEFTLPDGAAKSDKTITFTLDYNYDNRTEDYTISTSYEFTGYEMDGNTYDAGYTFEATEDKYVTSEYELTNTFTPTYSEPEREGYIFNGWFDGNTKVNVSELTAENEEIDGKTLTASWTEVTSNDIVITYDGEQRVVPIGTKLSELGDSPIKPSTETFTVYIDRNNGTFIIDTYEITKSYSLDKVYINGEELNENDYTFNEDATITTTYTASYEPDIFDLPQGVSGIYTAAVDGDRVESYDNVNDGDTLYYHYTETHTITVDGEVVAVVEHGKEYTLPINNKAKAMENIATVTFDYGDGRDNTYAYVRTRYNANGWSIDGEPHTNNEVITVNEDIVLDREYYESIQGIDFPRTPKRTGYRFDAWYLGDEVITSYDGTEDVTLTARWIKQLVITNMVDDTVYVVDEGYSEVLGSRDDKEEKFYNITFKYNYENSPEDKVVRISTQDKFVGWTANNDEYGIDDEITYTVNTTLTGRYETEINNKNLPSDPTRSGYTFLGWYNAAKGGELVDINTIKTNKTVYAHWENFDPETQVRVIWDGVPEIYDKGTTVDLDRSEGKEKTGRIATITFIMNNDNYDNMTVYVDKKSTRDHYVINGEDHVAVGNYTFNEDTVIDSVYSEEITYPKLPIISDNTFKGFFTSYEGGSEVTTLEGITRDSIFYAQWETEMVPVTFDGETTEYPKGTEIILPSGKTKESSSINITLDYGAGYKEVTITTAYTFDDYSVNGASYAASDKYVVNTPTVIISRYTSETTNNFVGYDNNNWDLGYETSQGTLTSWLDENDNAFDLNTLTGEDDNHNGDTYTASYESDVPSTINVTIDSMTPYEQETGKHMLIPQDKELTLDTPANETFTITFNNKGSESTVTGTKSYEFSHFTVDGVGEYQRTDDYTFYKDTVISSAYTNTYSYDGGIPEVSDELFTGWFTQAEGGSMVTTLDGTTSNTTLYAQYRTAGEHTIYFDDKAYVYDDTVTSVTPINEGYAATEYSKEITLTFIYQNDNYQNVSLPYVNEYSHIGWINEDDDTTYSETIDLTNVEDGTRFTSMYRREINIVEFSDYDPDDNTFLGWYTEPNAGYKVENFAGGTGNVTHYAHWTTSDQAIVTIDGEVEIYDIGSTLILPEVKSKNSELVTITFDPNNGEATFTKSKGTTYTFSGYRLEADNVVYEAEHEFVVEEDMTFNSEFISNATIDAWPENPTKQDYEFLGWYTALTNGIEVFNYDDITENTTLYALWTTNPESFVTLTNTVTGESLKVQKSTDWVFGDSKFNKDKKDKLGTITYKFNSAGYPDEIKDYYRTSTPTGYYIEGDDTLYNIDEAHQFTSDTNITPYYGNVVTDSHVGVDQFDYEVTNGDKQIKCFSKTNQTDPYDLEEYTCYENYDENDGDVTVYLHWKELKKITVTEPDGTTNEYTEGDTYNTGVNDSTKDSDGYTVTFKYQDGTTDDTTQSHMTSYTANGWLINGEHVDNNTDITLEEDIVKQYDYTETSTSITLPEPTRDDYTFVGWNSRANGKGTTYDNESINSLDKDTTVYAIWTKDEINITFVENGGSDVDDMTIGYDTPIGDLPTTSKENERITENNNDVIIGYIFDGWYRDPEFTSKVSSTATFTDDTTLYAKWVEDRFPYVYPKHEEDFVCTGSNYIDTGVKLYTQTNNDYLKDFEVGFTIESYTPRGQVKQAVFFNAKWEVTNLQWPGVAFRRKDETNGLELSSSAKKTRVAYAVESYSLPLEVRIYRIDNVIYLSTDGGVTKTQVQDTTGFSQFFDVNSYFCAGDNGNGGIQRYVKGTISNYYIKLGDYQGTVDDVTTHTVTYPDNSVETYGHNSIIELDANESTKADELGAAVTFDYNDGVTPSEIRYNTKTFTPNGFIVNDDTHYDDNSTLVVDEDKVITYDYISETDDVEFPDDPTRKYYVFDGWYTEGGDKVEYYDGAEDITLYAHWTRETVNIIYPDETITVDKGEAYILRTNDFAKADDNAAEVTFKYHDEETEDLVRYVKYHYTAKGWSIDGTAYADEASITPTTDITVTPEYTFETIEVEFPDDPTYDNHEFEGWFTEETGGIKLESYDGTDDIILHAQWSTSLPTDFDLDSDDVLIVKGDTHQIEVTFTPDGSTDTLTYTSSDDAIATVDTDGLITGVETGVTTIMVSADNADIDKIITVTVVSNKLESEEYDVLDKEKDDESKDRIVIGAEVKTLISEFKDNMTNPNEYIKIYDAEGNEVSEVDTVKTGLTIKLEINGRVYDEAIMIVRGDIDGDGLVDVADEAVLTDHILRITPIDDYRFYAADVDEDSILDVADDSKLTDFILRILDSLNE